MSSGEPLHSCCVNSVLVLGQYVGASRVVSVSGICPERNPQRDRTALHGSVTGDGALHIAALRNPGFKLARSNLC